MVCLFTITEETVAIVDLNAGTPIICHLFLTKSANAICTYVSTYNMTVLSVERYFAILDPLKYDIVRVKKRLPYVFVGEWLCMCLIFSYVPGNTTTKSDRCHVSSKMLDTLLWDMYSPYEFTIAFAVPLVITLFCYGRMLMCLRQSAQWTNGKSTISNQDKLRLAQMNIFKTCLIVTVVFILCWCSTETAIILYMAEYYENLASVHFTIGTLLILVNSCLNPYIYAIRYRDFKLELKRFMPKIY